MNVYGLHIHTDRELTNLELDEYVGRLGIEHFRGVFIEGYTSRQTSTSRMES